MNVLRVLGGALRDLAFPVFCAGCDEPVSAGPVPVCPPCLRRLRRADLEAVGAQCARHPTSDPAGLRVFSMWEFVQDGALQHLQHAMKYRNRPLYARALGAMMAPALGEWLGEWPGDPAPLTATPIPLHPSRYYERGYNQSQYLAEGIARGLDLDPPAALLVRSRPTRTQTALGVAARWSNVAGAFRATAGALPPGCNVLLVDDVLTTGATVASAADTLWAAGAETVIVATLAYAPP